MKRAIAIGTAAGAALLVAGASASLAVYPPDPENSSQTATTVPEGGSVTFTFGGKTPFLPGTTVSISSACTFNGQTFAGPSTTTTANASGLASVSLTFTRPGTCVVTASGQGKDGGVISASATVTITARAGGGGGGGGGLAQTGGNNTLTIAAVGGGLLLAGVGAVAVARRRERGNA